MTVDAIAHFGEIQVEELAPQHVACFRSVSSSPEEEAAEAMKQWLTEHGLEELTRLPNFGFDVDVTPEQQQSGLRGYEVWYPVPESAPASGGVTIRDFSGGLYAVMRLTNPFADPFAIIPAGWEHLLKWGHAAGDYDLGSHQCLERFIPDPEGPHLDLYLPLARRRS